MKKFWIVLGLLFFMILFGANEANGGVSFLLTGGYGGIANAGSIGGEGGWMGRNFLFGVGLSVTFTSGDWAETYFVSPNITWYKKRDHEEEGYGILGIRLTGTWFLVGTAGITQELTTEKRIEGSSSTEYPSEVARNNFSFSGQLQYVCKALIIGGGYHNRRGIVGRIGFEI